MYNKKSFWQQKLLIALGAVAGSLTLGLLFMPTNRLSNPGATSSSDQKTDLVVSSSAPSPSLDPTIAQAVTKTRIEQLKSTMLVSWQQQATAKSLTVDVPADYKGVTFDDVKLNSKEKVIALTFDDGPWPNSTVKILDILKKNDIRATFFMVGQALKNSPQIGQKVAEDGHEIGNHTYHHWYQYMNPQASAFEIEQTATEIYKTMGIKTSLFRPPGGILHNGVADYAKKHNYAIALWSADSVDYSRPPLARLISNITKESKPGGIVLMHDGGGDRSRTVEALPKVISYFKAQGYRFVTVTELLEMKEKEKGTTSAKK